MKGRAEAAVVNVLAAAVALAFVYPFWWMIVASFRSQAAILSDPLRLLPERFDLSGYAALGRIGGTPLVDFVLNSLVVTGAATLLGVAMTGLAPTRCIAGPTCRCSAWCATGSS